jgi:hypothetical protein
MRINYRGRVSGSVQINGGCFGGVSAEAHLGASKSALFVGNATYHLVALALIHLSDPHVHER